MHYELAKCLEKDEKLSLALEHVNKVFTKQAFTSVDMYMQYVLYTYIDYHMYIKYSL